MYLPVLGQAGFGSFTFPAFVLNRLGVFLLFLQTKQTTKQHPKAVMCKPGCVSRRWVRNIVHSCNLTLDFASNAGQIPLFELSAYALESVAPPLE
jgi:hypothetical protein